jgi:hypothetical protein
MNGIIFYPQDTTPLFAGFTARHQIKLPNLHTGEVCCLHM